FTSDVVFGGGTLETMLLGGYTFMNKDLAAFYGITGPVGAAFERVTLDPSKRPGLLTQGAFLAQHAKANQTSPVQRALVVRTTSLWDPPAPPPANVPSLAQPDPTLSTRERLEMHRKNPACAGCHALMDPIGFGFEHFDGVGLWRDTDGATPIDATGEISG